MNGDTWRAFAQLWRSVGDRDQIRMPFAEGVVHLVKHRLEAPVGAVTEKHTERVEHGAEHARHAQHTNGAAIDSEPGASQVLFDLSAQANH
jgi:hypothetical protein